MLRGKQFQSCRWGGGRELSRSGSPSLCLIFTTLFLPPSPRSPLPPPRIYHQMEELRAEKPVFTSNASLSICLHPPSPSPLSQRRPPPPPPQRLSRYRSPFLLSSPSSAPVCISFSPHFSPLCPPTSARAAEQIKCDIGCFIPELHTRWKLLFMTQTKSFFTVIPPNCCTMIREEPDMIMMRSDWE